MTDQTPEARAVAVAWRWRLRSGVDWTYGLSCKSAEQDIANGWHIEVQPLYAHPSPALKVAVEARALDAAIRAWTDAEPGPDAKSERDGMTAAILAYLATIRAQEG